MTGIFQTRIPYDHTNPLPLPGIRPLGDAPWITRDEAHDGQMAERDRLIATQRDKVIAMDAAARPAVLELLDRILADHYPDATDSVTRPDGITVPIDRDDPMATLGRLVQEDLCILEKRGEEHVLTAAALCFPASWTLTEKFNRPLIAIHVPVAPYDDNIARRVQRLFDGIQVDKPLWRFNVLSYVDPALYQPLSETAPKIHHGDVEKPYLRSERQCMIRLPETRAVIFAIHTFLVPKAQLATA